VVRVRPADVLAALVLRVGQPVARIDAELRQALVLVLPGRLLDLLVDLRDGLLADLVVLPLEANPGVVARRDEAGGEVLAGGAGRDVPVGLRDRRAAAALVRALDAELDRAVQLLDAVELERDLEVDAPALDRRLDGLVERLLNVGAAAPAACGQEAGQQGECDE